MKQRLGYIDHSFHKKTKSTYFLRDILAEHFDVIDIWDESWNGGEILTAEFINSQNFEYVLFFQSLLPISELKKIEAKIIWVPMYDSAVLKKDFFWLELSSLSIKIISFSRTLSQKMKGFRLDVFDVQYFFDPRNFLTVTGFDEIRIFLWQRTDISFETIKKLFGDQKIGKIVLKLDVDPGYEVCRPTESEIEKYNIEIVEWFDSSDEYIKILSTCNVFISPRKFEGIGMSFLEAMSMGMAVVAYDNPTMNEYIVNDKNGYLFTDNNIKIIDLKDILKIGDASKRYCEVGYEKWSTDCTMVVNFIMADFNDRIVLTKVNLLCVEIAKLSDYASCKIKSIWDCSVKTLVHRK